MTLLVETYLVHTCFSKVNVIFCHEDRETLRGLKEPIASRFYRVGQPATKE